MGRRIFWLWSGQSYLTRRSRQHPQQQFHAGTEGKSVGGFFVVFAIMLLVGAPCAQADSGEEQFLRDIAEHNAEGGNLVGGDKALLQLGHAVCTDLAAYLSKGRSWDDAVDIQRNQLARLAPGWNRWDVAGVLIYSQSALCPELLPQP
jgi:hypothetical protein